MGWHTRVTRFGDVHMVFGQEKENTRTIACVIMAAFQIHGIVRGEPTFFSEADILEKARAMGIQVGDKGLRIDPIRQLLNAPEFRMMGW